MRVHRVALERHMAFGLPTTHISHWYLWVGVYHMASAIKKCMLSILRQPSLPYCMLWSLTAASENRSSKYWDNSLKGEFSFPYLCATLFIHKKGTHAF